MERKQSDVDPSKTIVDPSDFVKKHALVEEVDSKPVLSIKGAQVLTALKESLAQSNPELQGASP
jgi:hypothetical protein